MEAPGNVPQQDQGELLAVDNGEQPRLRIMAFIAHAERTKEDSKLLMRRTKGFFFLYKAAVSMSGGIRKFRYK
jgi:hypothetical protein